MVWNRQPAITPEPAPAPSTALQTKPKIMIGTPSRDEKLYTWWSMKMLEPLHTPDSRFDKAFQMIRGVPVSVARDLIVEAALADPAVTHVMWVDSDNICMTPPNPNDAIQMLLACNQPIVSGLYRAKQAVGFNYAFWADVSTEGKPGFVPVQSFTGNWLQMGAVGMGFCLVRTEVYKRLSRPWYPWTTASPSEDFAFCIAARKAGFAVNVFTEVQLRHLGELCVNPDGKCQVLEA